MSTVADAGPVIDREPVLERMRPPWGRIDASIACWSGDDARRSYVESDELLVVEDAFPREVTAALQSAAARLRPRAVRKGVPGYKASESVCFADVRELAPELESLYKDPALVLALSRVAGTSLQPCPERDLHSCALYYYTQPGDHIGWHFDSSHYRGARYTVLVGVVNRTTQSRLECQLYKKVKGRRPEARSLSTEPGTLVFFNGDRLWHSVSKLEAGAERVVLTLEYVTDPSMNLLRRLISDFKDAATYFGFRRRGVRSAAAPFPAPAPGRGRAPGGPP